MNNNKNRQQIITLGDSQVDVGNTHIHTSIEKKLNFVGTAIKDTKTNIITFKDIKEVVINDFTQFLNTDRCAMRVEIKYQDKNKLIEDIYDNFGNMVTWERHFNDNGDEVYFKHNTNGIERETVYEYNEDRLLIKSETIDLFTDLYNYNNDGTIIRTTKYVDNREDEIVLLDNNKNVIKKIK